MNSLARLGCLCLLVVSLTGCSDDKTCLSVCNSAQDQDCTIIDSCSGFCSSTRALRDKASCESEYDAYHDCAMSSPTCSIDALCYSETNALTTCIGVWCAANPSDADCVTLDNSW
jgi:hypothetical protein